MLIEAVGLGLFISLLFTEFMGLAAGGMVVPGYIALFLTQPTHIVGTLVAAFATYLIVHSLSRYMVIYGRRRLVFTLLVGFLIGFASKSMLATEWGTNWATFASVGYVIPGLMAYWMERQGVLETTCSLAMAVTVVRLMMIVFNGGAPLEVEIY